MKNTDIKEVKWNNDEVVALYKGHNCIYQKELCNVLAGSYTKSGSYTFRYNNTQNIPITLAADNTFSRKVDIDRMTTCYQMFYKQSYLKTLTSFPDTSKVTNMGYMFCGCTGLESLDLTNIKTANVTYMSNMFWGVALKSLDLRTFNTKQVTDMSEMFAYSSLENINLSKFNTGNVTTMAEMFRACRSLDSIDLSSFNTSNVTNMNATFLSCVFTTLDISNFDVSNVTNMDSMFSSCFNLKTLILGDFDMGRVVNTNFMFTYDNNLTTIQGNITNIRVDLDLSVSPLTNDSAMVIINGLADVTATRTLSLRYTAYNKLTDEQLLLATSKGWTVTSN